MRSRPQIPFVIAGAIALVLAAVGLTPFDTAFVMLASAPVVWVALYHQPRLAWATNLAAGVAVYVAEGPSRDSAGTALSFFIVVGVAVEMSQRLLRGERESVDALRTIRDQQREIFNHIPDTAILVVDPTGRFVSVEGGLFSTGTVNRDDVLGKRLEDVVPENKFEAYRAALSAALNGETQQLEHRGLHRDAIYAVEVMPLRDRNGAIIAAMSVARDVTQRKAAEARLQHLASHDDLTGLWNRRRFSEAVRGQLMRARRHGDQAALLVIDLDGFKAVNDEFGHAAGDRLLQAVADAIRGRLRASDHAGRLGGDEFAVLLNGVSVAETEAVAGEFRLAIAAATIRFGGVEVKTGASVGAVTIDAETVDEGALLAAADAAMYAEKSR